VDAKVLTTARDRLLRLAWEHFSSDPHVLGIFLGGSLAAGTADAYSDIDMRVVVTADSHAAFVARRREIPREWSDFLFNEWVPGAQHCVSHFKPFGKIDIFYFNADALVPSPWYALPIKILHDPKGLIADLVNRSKDLRFTVLHNDIDFSISKGLAAVHEAYRRTMREELFYAQTLLDELRHHVMQADDWLFDRTPETALAAKFDKRASEPVRAVLVSSYAPCEREAMLTALKTLAALYRQQVLAMHDKFSLARPVENDIAAFDCLVGI
jgi:predicted nucleotidyltransferase